MRWLFVGVKNRETDSSYKGDSFDLTNEETGYKQRPRMHLPIADEFRRSRFGMPRHNHSHSTNSKKGSGEGAGLIANAQPDPTASAVSPGYTPAKERFGSQGQDVSSGGTNYYDRDRTSQDIGIAVGKPDPYQSAHIEQKRQQQGHNTKPSAQWPKEGDQVRPEVHNALWGVGRAS